MYCSSYNIESNPKRTLNNQKYSSMIQFLVDIWEILVELSVVHYRICLEKTPDKSEITREDNIRSRYCGILPVSTDAINTLTKIMKMLWGWIRSILKRRFGHHPSTSLKILANRLSLSHQDVGYEICCERSPQDPGKNGEDSEYNPGALPQKGRNFHGLS